LEKKVNKQNNDNSEVNIKSLVQSYQNDKISYLSILEKISQEIVRINIKINDIPTSNEPTTKVNDAIAICLSSEFETIKESITKDLKNEFERKFEIEKLKIKNQKNLLTISLISISLSSIIISIIAYIN